MHKNLNVIERPVEAEQPLRLNNPRAPLFTSFHGAFGWLDPSGDGAAAQHAVLVAGIQTDKRILILDEDSGDIDQCVRSAIEFKDRYLVSNFFVDTSDSDLMTHLWDADGLTRYFSLGKDPVGRDIWAHDNQRWPMFRDRETVAQIVPVPLTVVQSPYLGSQRLNRLTHDEKLLVHSSCANTQWVVDQAKLADVSRHPVFRALCYLVWGIDRDTRQIVSIPTTQTSVRAYPNLKKGHR